MDLVTALNKFQFKKVDDGSLTGFDEDEDTPIMTTKRYAKIPEPEENARISIPCHPQYSKFIYLNEEETYFLDLKTEEINRILKRVNAVIDEVIEEKNSVEFDNHYKKEDIALSWITGLGMLIMAFVYSYSLYDISNKNK